MMTCLKIFVLVGLLAFFPPAQAAEWVRFETPDDATVALLEGLLRDELTRPGSHYQYAPEAAKTAEAAWVRMVGRDPPLLFVMLRGGYCGSGGCAIYGFRQTKGKWRTIYFHFGGEGIELLDASSKRHRDIRQYESMGGGQLIEVVSRWDGSAYQVVRRRPGN